MAFELYQIAHRQQGCTRQSEAPARFVSQSGPEVFQIDAVAEKSHSLHWGAKGNGAHFKGIADRNGPVALGKRPTNHMANDWKFSMAIQIRTPTRDNDRLGEPPTQHDSYYAVRVEEVGIDEIKTITLLLKSQNVAGNAHVHENRSNRKTQLWDYQVTRVIYCERAEILNWWYLSPVSALV